MSVLEAGFVRAKAKAKEIIDYVERVYLAAKILFLIHKLTKLQEGNSELIKGNRLLTEEILRLEADRKARLQSQRLGNP